jgi:hypothetical protein
VVVEWSALSRPAVVILVTAEFMFIPLCSGILFENKRTENHNKKGGENQLQVLFLRACILMVLGGWNPTT